MWDWIGFGAHKLPPASDASPEERIERSKAMLARVLDLGTTVAFVGSGLSRVLGYPTWSEMASEVIERTLRALSSCPGSVKDFEIERLQRFRAFLKAGNVEDGERLMSFVTACQETLERGLGGCEPYYEYLRERFDYRNLRERLARPPEPREQPDNPFDVLMELPICRFATTNYDCELELALHRRREIPLEHFGLETSGEHSDVSASGLRSFTHKLKYCDQMAAFPVAWIAANANMVFHCHGRFDEPDSVIASELDYQRLYLTSEKGAKPIYQRSIELLLSSNPLLFLGYGLRDEDLLRPLRMLHVLDRQDNRERPLFALMHQRKPDDLDQQEYLFHRYGLKVIPFSAPSGSGNWARSYCGALREIKSHWQDLRKKWLEKPVFRRVSIPNPAPKPYRYPKIRDTSRLSLNPQAHFREKQRLIRSLIRSDVRALVLLGDNGSGKTWHAVEMFESLAREREGGFAGYFFWDAHFSDDALTGRERLLHYLDPNHELPGAYLDRLRQLLRSKRYLLVIEGTERLLRQRDNLEEGDAFSPAFAEALKAFADPEGRSTVVLVSTLWPRELGQQPRSADEPLQCFRLSRLHAADLEGLPPFDRLARSQLSALCGLLDGHAYALLLATKFLTHQEFPSTPAERLEELLSYLGGETPEDRVDAMVRRIVELLDRQTNKLTIPLIKRLAVFISPFDQGIVKLCYEQACKLRKLSERDAVPVVKLRDLLVNACLLLEMDVGRSDETVFYALHPIVRSYLYKCRARSGGSALPSFNLSGLVIDRLGTHPEHKEDFDIVVELFEELDRKSKEDLDAENVVEAREAIRRLLSLMRSRLSAFGILPWANYDRYASFAYRLLALVKRASPRTWAHCSREDMTTVEDRDGVLYPGDLAWLYNELGLVLEAEGLAADAEVIWSQGYDINQLIEGAGDTDSLGEFVQHSRLNFGHLYIDLGMLRNAEDFLRQGERHNHSINDQSMAGCILGFRAVIEWLHNATVESDALYSAACDKLKASGNKRGRVYFLGQHVLLLSQLGRHEDMDGLIQTCRALATQGRYEDLFSYIDIAQAEIQRKKNELPDARLRYNQILQRVRREGDRKVESIVLSGLSRIALQQGDVEGARRLAFDGLCLTNVIGLRSRQLRALKGLAEAMNANGQRALAAAYLRLVKQMAEEEGNLRTLHEAEESLRTLDEASIP